MSWMLPLRTAPLPTLDSRYCTLLNLSTDAVALLTPGGVLLDVNSRWEQVLGVSRERVIGRHLREFAPAGHENESVLGFRRHLDASGQPSPPVPVVSADGSTAYLEFSLSRAQLDGQDLVLTIGRDVTDAVEARRRLEASEARYRALIENLPEIVWSATPLGRILFISPNVATVGGFSAEHILAAPASFWFDRVHPDDQPAVRDAYSCVVERECEVEYRWRVESGDWIWLRSRAKLRETPAGRIVEGTCADVTARRHLEEQVRQSQKMEAIGELTGGVAHDFNNLLSVILGNGEFLRDALAEDDPRRDDAEAVLEAAGRAASLTRQLLAFSRKQVLEPRVLQLNDTVAGIEKMLRRVIGENIALHVTLAPDLGTVRADPGQIEQVIMNLAVNARDAMPRGGQLSIETASVQIRPGTLAQSLGLDPGDYVRLSVRDTGCGMDAATQRRIFEPFFTTKALNKGTGLGLSTCYGIVKQSDGAIAVDSEPGSGTTFDVLLPVIAEAVEDAAGPGMALAGTRALS